MSISSIMNKWDSSKQVERTIFTSAGKGAAIGGMTGAIVTGVGGNKKNIQVGTTAGMVFGFNAGLIKGAISGGTKYAVGHVYHALFGKSK